MSSQALMSHFKLQFYGTTCNSMKIQVPSDLRPFCRYYSLSSRFFTRPTTKCSPGLRHHLPWEAFRDPRGVGWVVPLGALRGAFVALVSPSLAIVCSLFSSFGCELEGRAWGLLFFLQHLAQPLERGRHSTNGCRANGRLAGLEILA